MQIEVLREAILKGQKDAACEAARALLNEGYKVEDIIHTGLTESLRLLDVKCTTEEFNLLEIMLSGRAMMAVMDDVIAEWLPSATVAKDNSASIVLGTIKGDIHELGKHVVKVILIADGYRVVDLGKDVPPLAFVESAAMEGASFIGVSSLITLTIPYIREIKNLLLREGLTDVHVIAGGAAIQQSDKEDLNVDYVAKNAFDGLHYIQNVLSGMPPDSIE